jgi:hypothetical protein
MINIMPAVLSKHWMLMAEAKIPAAALPEQAV